MYINQFCYNQISKHYDDTYFHFVVVNAVRWLALNNAHIAEQHHHKIHSYNNYHDKTNRFLP